MKKSLLFVACMLLVMASCKKDDETNTPQTQNPMTENTMSETESKIVSFIEKVKNHENGEKSNETMSYDEAVVLLENTLNYCHSFTSLPKENIQFDTIYMKINGVNDNAISVSDAVFAYNSLIEEVREVYSSVELTDKKLHYVMVDDITDELAKDSGREVEVVVMTGRETQREDPPFTTTPWYGVPFTGNQYYGVQGAAEALENAVTQYDVAHSILYPPYPNMHAFVSDLEIYAIYNHKNSDWTFYGSPNTIFTTDVMNRLYASIMVNTHEENMAIGVFGVHGYYQTIVEPRNVIDSMADHQVTVFYATREWVFDDPNIGGEYPSDIVPSN